MTRRFFCIFVGLLLAASFTRADETVHTLRVLTYNIHHGEGTDGKLDLERIAKVILSVKPDLVALQEVDQKTQRTGGVDQIQRLAELTSMHPAYGRAMEYEGGGYGVAMLSRWPIGETATHPLPSPKGVEPRVVLSSVIAPPGSDLKIQFMVTHVDHRADPKHRAAQLEKIHEIFPPIGYELPQMIAGDFNATPESQEMQNFLGAWTDTAEGEKFLTSPSDKPRTKIDYILVRPGARWRVMETRALEEAVASDHRAVFAELKVK